MSPEDLAEVPVGKQETVHASAFPFVPSTSAPRSNFRSRLWRLHWISISGHIRHSAYCCVRLRRFIVSRRIHAKSADFARREDFPNACFPRQTKWRQKHAKIPDSCFFFPEKNVNLILSCYSFSFPWLIILFFGVLWNRSLLLCRSVELSTCTWHCGKLKFYSDGPLEASSLPKSRSYFPKNWCGKRQRYNHNVGSTSRVHHASKTCQYAGFVRLDVFAGTVPFKDCPYFFSPSCFLSSCPSLYILFDYWIIHAMSSFERVCDLHVLSFSIFKRTE